MTLLLIVFIVGGTWAFVDFDSRIDRSASETVSKKTDGKVTVEIRRTFDCFGDPEWSEDAIRVSFVDEVVFSSDAKKIPASETITFEFSEAEIEENSLTVYANPISPDDDFSETAALRAMTVELIYAGKLIAKEIFQDDGSGFSVGGVVEFAIPDQDAYDDHDH
jgi:hypothetical protein